MPPRPLALSDQQLDTLHRLAWPLAPDDRSAFLELVAQRLQEQGGNIGDGALHRIAVEAQRQFWRPPSFTVGKYD
jgi:hypothetical protein